jgi:glycosyltransferase involved in cell wall biosynthesis
VNLTKELPLISVIISVLNDLKNLKETLLHLSEIEYKNLEIVVVDCVSTDGTRAFLDAYADKRLRYISERDNGIYDAWNKGVRFAKGDYLAFLGAGDYYNRSGLQKLVQCATEHPTAELITGKVLVHNGVKIIKERGSAWSWRKFRNNMNIAHPGALHSRGLFERVGSFDVSFRIAGDYQLLLRAGETLRTAYLNEPVALMLSGGISHGGRDAIFEAHRAKVSTDSVARLNANLTTAWMLFKFYIKQALRQKL